MFLSSFVSKVFILNAKTTSFFSPSASRTCDKQARPHLVMDMKLNEYVAQLQVLMCGLFNVEISGPDLGTVFT